RPVMEVLDLQGRRVAFARAGRLDDTPLVFQPDEEADYFLRIYDQTYRGGAEYVYSIDLHTDPHVLAVQPVSGKIGTELAAQIVGFNLPDAQPLDFFRGRTPLQQALATIRCPDRLLTYDRQLPVTPRQAGLDSFAWRFAS